MADVFFGPIIGMQFRQTHFCLQLFSSRPKICVMGFSFFVKHYFDPCLAANVCTQFMDDFAAAVNIFSEMIPALRKLSDCSRESGLELPAHQCKIGTKKPDYLGSTITPGGTSPESAKIGKFFGQTRMPSTLKKVKRLIGLVKFLRNCIPNLGTNLLPLYMFLRKKRLHNHQRSLGVF